MARCKSMHGANEYAGLAAALAVPEDLEAHSFAIGSDEFVVLSFGLPGDAASPGIADVLTASERAVASLALQGRSNLEIARARGKSAQTIANQLGAIYGKLGVRSRRELAARWQESRKKQ